MCGVFSVRSHERDVARLTYFASSRSSTADRSRRASLSRRLATSSARWARSPGVRRGEASALPGEVAIGHTRYSTTGGAYWPNAQPLVHHGTARTVALAHNGNLVDPAPLRDELLATAVRLGSTSDTEVVAALIGRDPAPPHEAVASAMRRLVGAYSIVAIADGRLSRSATRSASGRHARPHRGRLGGCLRRARSTSSAPTRTGRPPRRGGWVDDEGPLAQAVLPQRCVHLRARLLARRLEAAGRASTRPASGWASGSPRRRPRTPIS
jgi:hypothetical protein